MINFRAELQRSVVMSLFEVSFHVHTSYLACTQTLQHGQGRYRLLHTLMWEHENMFSLSLSHTLMWEHENIFSLSFTTHTHVRTWEHAFSFFTTHTHVRTWKYILSFFYYTHSCENMTSCSLFLSLHTLMWEHDNIFSLSFTTHTHVRTWHHVLSFLCTTYTTTPTFC